MVSLKTIVPILFGIVAGSENLEASPQRSLICLNPEKRIESSLETRLYSEEPDTLTNIPVEEWPNISRPPGIPEFPFKHATFFRKPDGSVTLEKMLFYSLGDWDLNWWVMSADSAGLPDTTNILWSATVRIQPYQINTINLPDIQIPGDNFLVFENIDPSASWPIACSPDYPGGSYLLDEYYGWLFSPLTFCVAEVVASEPTGIERGDKKIIYPNFALNQNFPNPFNPRTTIEYQMPESANDKPVSVRIYDARGRKVKTLFEGPGKAGKYKISWDGTNDSGERLGSGPYFCQLKAGNYTSRRKMVMIE